MNGDIKEVLADIIGDYKLGVMNTEALVTDIVNGLKEKEYQIKKIVKFKVGDTIGTHCGNYIDTVITDITDGDIIRRSIAGNFNDNGVLHVFDTNTYDELIDKGYRVKG